MLCRGFVDSYAVVIPGSWSNVDFPSWVFFWVAIFALLVVRVTCIFAEPALVSIVLKLVVL